MRRHISKLFMACLMAMTLMVVSAASAFAAGTGMDWSGDSKITVQGTGVAPTYAVNAVQARMLARRAAVVDAYRQLAEMVKGVNVDSETTVENMMVTSDVTKTKVTALIQGARASRSRQSMAAAMRSRWRCLSSAHRILSQRLSCRRTRCRRASRLRMHLSRPARRLPYRSTCR